MGSRKPDGNRYVEEDFNRVWSDEVLNGPRDSVELRRARELVAYIDTADYLLDLHSMSAPSAPLMVCGVRPKGGQKSINLATKIGLPEWLMVDTGHVNGLRMIERAAFGDPSKHNTAILLEAGQHWESLRANCPRNHLEVLKGNRRCRCRLGRFALQLACNSAKGGASH